MKTLEDQVRYCMEMWADTRNSDIKLTQKVWKTFYNSRVKQNEHGLYIYMDDLFQLPSQDSIKRVRAHIQNDMHELLPTSFDVMKKRKQATKTWREYLGYDVDPNLWRVHYEDSEMLERQLKRALEQEGIIVEEEVQVTLL